MNGYIEGFSDADEIKFCPNCGGEIAARCANGMAECEECGSVFGVIYEYRPEEGEA